MSIGQGPRSGSIAPTARVRDYTARFDKFLEQHVVPLEEDLARQNVGVAAALLLYSGRGDATFVAGRQVGSGWSALRLVD